MNVESECIVVDESRSHLRADQFVEEAINQDYVRHVEMKSILRC
jgi:hypothetical protein